MKLFSLSFLLLNIIHGVFSQPPPLQDSNGDLVTAQHEYYISNAGAGFHGGIGLPEWAGTRCPANIIQMGSETQPGLPVTLHPVIPLPKFLPIYANLTLVRISFSGSVTGCLEGEGYWRVEYVEEAQKTLVVAGTLSEVQLSSQFMIQQTGGWNNNVYTFVSCAHLKCRDEIGLYSMGGQQHLSVIYPNELPYTFKFVKKDAGNGIRLPK
ncbi:endogenous alpha-amylase/subtilisin inhibitor-like [Andrographis paniculata]|uniref:endogenous alpha-amylase/subtilisin inhibitor-like n=1 Tax=Andrographis paniculata TaxID=175694 RepID=UPI0021E938B1|nr:endogenous alpha-amylase/subtilisin inhibitor-like [Andrographis paniculata]